MEEITLYEPYNFRENILKVKVKQNCIKNRIKNLFK